MVLARHRHQRIVVAPAVRHDHEHGVVAVDRIGIHGLHQFLDTLVDHCDGRV